MNSDDEKLISAEKALERILKCDENSKINHKGHILMTDEHNKTILKKYALACKPDNTIRTIITKVSTVKYLSAFIKKPLEKAKRKDIEDFIEHITERKISNTTINLYKIHIKVFYKWLLKTEEGYPTLVSWIKVNQAKSKSEDSETLTREEIKKLIDTSIIPRDKCLISLLYDAGLRVGEATGIRLKDIKEDEYGIKIRVDGKTGPRNVRLVNAVPLVKKWINDHPFKDNSNSYLFICLTKNIGKSLLPYGAYKVVKKIAIQAKINKKIHPHSFRHAKLTHLAEEGFNEMDLRIFAGWSKSSSMPEVYLHNNERSVDEKILRKNGLLSISEEKKQEEDKKVLKPKNCPMCDTLNDVSNRFCAKCGQILDVKAIKDIESSKGVMVDMIINNGMKQRLMEQMKQEIMKEIKLEMGIKV